MYSIFSATWEGESGIMVKHLNFNKSVAHGNRSVRVFFICTTEIALDC